MARLTYKELAKEKIKDKRNVVISEAFDKENKFLGYAIVEQLVTEENGKETRFFLKSGLGIIDKQGLLNLKEAVEQACMKAGLCEK